MSDKINACSQQSPSRLAPIETCPYTQNTRTAQKVHTTVSVTPQYNNPILIVSAQKHKKGDKLHNCRVQHETLANETTDSLAAKKLNERGVPSRSPLVSQEANPGAEKSPSPEARYREGDGGVEMDSVAERNREVAMVTLPKRVCEDTSSFPPVRAYIPMSSESRQGPEMWKRGKGQLEDDPRYLALRKEVETRGLTRAMKEAGTCEWRHIVLLHAIGQGDLEVVKLICDTQPNINQGYGRAVYGNLVEEEGETPLTLAIRQGKREIAEYLLEQGAHPTPRAKGRISALVTACESGEHQILDRLLHHPGTRINRLAPSKGKEETTLLAAAASKGDTDTVAKLLKRKDVDVNLGVPLIKAARGKHGEIVKMLLRRKDIDLTQADEEGVSLLEVIYDTNDPELVQCLLVRSQMARHAPQPDFNMSIPRQGHIGERGIAVTESRQTEGLRMTPLAYAVASGDEYAAENLLLYRYIDPNATGEFVSDGRQGYRNASHSQEGVEVRRHTPLTLAAMLGREDMMDRLLAHKKTSVMEGAECKIHTEMPNKGDRDAVGTRRHAPGGTVYPLSFAAGEGHVACVQKLLDRPDMRKEQVEEAMMFAVRKGQIGSIQTILTHPKWGHSVVHSPSTRALMREPQVSRAVKEELALHISSQGCMESARTDVEEGESARLFHAIEKGDQDVVKEIIGGGQSREILHVLRHRSAEGLPGSMRHSALTFAVACKKPEMVALILSASPELAGTTAVDEQGNKYHPVELAAK